MRSYLKWGRLPASFVYTGTTDRPTTIRHIQYRDEDIRMFEDVQPIDENVVDWIIVEGLGEVERIGELCRHFDVEPLVIEDVLNVSQRTKLDQYQNYWFFVVRYWYLDGESIQDDYLSLLLFEDKLLCFTEGENRFVDRVFARLSDPLAPLSERGHDYLFYVLYDMIVDDGLRVADHLCEQIDAMETNLLRLNDGDQMTLYEHRQDLAALRSMANQLLISAPKDNFHHERFIAEATYKYYDDVYDHLHRMHQQVQLATDQVGHMLDFYLNQASHRMNQIMMTLTIFSVIFIPLSFLAGVFGMNFIHFPILDNPYGLLYFTLVCLAVPVGMVLYFKWKKWF